MYPRAYPLLMLLALVVGAWLSRPRHARLGLSPSERLGLLLGAFCGAMIGAKLPFALSDWEGLRSGWVWLENGKTIVFGLAGGYLGVEMAKAALGITTKTGDSFAVPVAVSVAIGRLACFAGGCCFGAPTSLPWGLDFGDGMRRHPTQLYEAAFHLTMAAILIGLERAGIFPYQRIKFYLIGYLAYRFLTEFIRPEPTIGLGLTGYQWASLFLIGVFSALWWRDARLIGQASDRAVSRGE